MISLLLLAGVFGGGDTLSAVAGDLPAVVAPNRLWISNTRQFREGERAKVQVETSDDGYLLVFNYDTEGRLRVIFPVEPGEDNLVRAGRRYEVRGRGDRESFIVGRDGQGLVYAAVSADPFRLSDIESGGNWDYSRLYLSEDSKDPEADITDLVQRLSSGRGFDYDVLDYRVYGYNNQYRVTSVGWYPRSYGYWDDYYCDPWYRTSLFGCGYYPSGGWYLGGYYGNRWGYGGGYYNNWGWRGRYWNTPIYRNPNYRYPVVSGRPRGYTIVRRGFGEGARPRLGGTFSGSLPRPLGSERPIYGRPRDNGRARPGDERIDRPVNDAPRGVGGDTRPRGRRSPIGAADRPNVEREPSAGRGPVDFGGGVGRRARGGDDRSAAPRYEPPARSERPSVERPQADGPRYERPRESPRYERPRESPRYERPRESPPPRAEPRSSPPPRAEPRSSPQPSRDGSRGGGGGGGGGGSRGGGGGGGGRPRGRP